MNRMLDFLRGRLAGPPDATDRHLLDRFLSDRDEEAFAEVVWRHGPLVWGVCRRRLANVHDAEDAFQASFLVLVRRAAGLGDEIPLGPWLHRVAVMTTRNVIRGNRRRSAVSGPMELDIPAPPPAESGFDLDAALLALPDRERNAVVLCHLQGFTRKEAAARLGCPEGTLSARLSRALARLRSKFGGLTPAGAAAVPVGLSAATVRAATVSVTSSLTAAGVGPAVVGLTNGVLRMFWVKKVTAAAVVAVACGGLVVGIASAQKDGKPVNSPLAADPPADPAVEAKRLAAKIEELKRQQAEVERALKVVQAEAEKKAAERALKWYVERQQAAVEKLSADIVVHVMEDPARGAMRGVFPYEVRELIGGKVGEVMCSSIPVLEAYLARAFTDPKGPRTLRITADKHTTYEHVQKVFAACAKAGFTKATFSQWYGADQWSKFLLGEKAAAEKLEQPSPPTEIDLSKYAPRKW